MEKRKSRSLARRSSILKIDINKEEDTGILCKGRKSSRRVSFAETYQVKEFPRDSPQVWRRNSSEDEDEDSTGNKNNNGDAGNQVTVTGLDKLLTGTIQSQVYENLTECPIPEISSDSLNMSKLFDVNRTILGPVDMDTTDMVETENIELPYMDTGQDYSTEIRFDASSFLNNLKGKPSDRLKTIQIYSPSHQYSSVKENLGTTCSVETKRDRSPLKSLSVAQQSAQDSHMISPEKPFHLFDMDIEPEHKIDAKSFLTNLIGPKQHKTTIDKTFSDFDLSARIGTAHDSADDENMDETTCYGGIVGKDAVKELTSQISAKMEGQTSQVTNNGLNTRHPFADVKLTGHIEKENDSKMMEVQMPYREDRASETTEVEETKCHGGILSMIGTAGDNCSQSKMQLPKSGHSMSASDQTYVMEETKCLGGILNKSLTNGISNQIQYSEMKLKQALDMEETKCHGGILNKTSITNEMNGVSMSPLDQSVQMEETKPLSGIFDKGQAIELTNQKQIDQTEIYQSFDMEETRCQGGILNKSNVTKGHQEHSSSPSNQVLEMEETRCITSVINNNVTKEQPSLMQINETVVYQNLDMEVTKCQGGILNRSCVTKDTEEETNVKNQSGCQKSNCTGEIWSSNMTDENVQIYSPLKESCKSANDEGEKKVDRNQVTPSSMEVKYDLYPVNQTLIMDETKCVGGIVDKNTKELTENFDKTKCCPQEMEETKCQGGILDRSNSVKKLYPSNASSNKTLEMEETKCLTSLIDQNNAKESITKAQVDEAEVNAVTDMDKETSKSTASIPNLEENVAFNKIENQTCLMEETGCRGGIMDNFGTKHLSLNVSLPQLKTDKISPMEETKCICGILNRSHTEKLSSVIASQEITLHDTVMMEETKCVGGLKKFDVEEVSFDAHKETTKNHTVAMDITSCIKDTSTVTETNLYQSGNKEDQELLLCKADVSEDFNNTVTQRTLLKDTKSVSEVLQEDSVTKINIQEQADEDDNTEITFKKVEEPCSNYADEFTKETSQTLTRLQKLKEMLILSKRKTPAHLKRPVESTAEVELDLGLTNNSGTSSSFNSGNTDSPAHKKKKLFDTNTDNCISRMGERISSDSDMVGFDINDEQMPEFMKTDDLLSITAFTMDSNEAHRSTTNDKPVRTGLSSTCLQLGLSETDSNDNQNLDINDQKLSESLTLTTEDTIEDKLDLGSDPLSSTALTTTVNDTHCNPEDISDSKKHHLPSVTSTVNSDDTSSSGSKDMSLYQKQSLLSFTTDSCLSFIIPDGHVTLETFKKAMSVKSCVLVKNSGRRSSFLAPRIDTSDVGEVILAELTLDPLVKATKAAYDDVKERTERNEEMASQLQETLEETQPHIFQDCVNLEGSEALALRSQVHGLHRTCHKLSRLYWTNRTKEATAEALKIVQEEGLSKVNSILDEIRSDKRTTEKFIQSIDDDLEDFLKTSVQLEDLEQKKNMLEREMESVQLSIEDNEAIKKDLAERIDRQEQEGNIEELIAAAKQIIKLNLYLQEWDLYSLDDSCAVFTFLNGELELRIVFNRTTHKTYIQSVDIQSHLNPGCTKISKRLAHSMALTGISMERLKKYSALEDLPRLLNEVSSNISEIRHFCADLNRLSLSKDVKVDHRRIICDFWSLNTLDEIRVALDFNPSCPLTTQANIDVQVIMGTIRPEKILDDLQAVKPGKKYLSRLFSAITF